MTSKLLNLKGLPVSFLQQPTPDQHCHTAELSADCRGRAKCQKFPPETEEGVFVGFSFFLLLAGSTGSIKLQQNAPPTTWARGPQPPPVTGPRRANVGDSKPLFPSHSVIVGGGAQPSLCLHPLHPVGTVPGGGEGSCRAWEASVCLSSCSWNHESCGKSQSPVAPPPHP